MIHHPRTETPAAVRLHANTLFVSLELSKSHWLLTVGTPGSDKLSWHTVAGGDSAGLLQLLTRLQASAARRTGTPVPVAVIQEAALDGFLVARRGSARR